MTKKRLLFVIHRLDAGGAEKSLVSLLNSLPLENYDVDLLAINPTGIFRNQVPDCINMLDSPTELKCSAMAFGSVWSERHVGFRIWLIKLFAIFAEQCIRLCAKKSMNHAQFNYWFWKHFIPVSDKKYDVAISYIDGCNYYVADKVNADLKIMWIHNDYNKLSSVASFDLPYLSKAYKVCTISDICKQALTDNFPTINEKFEVVENISSSRIINSQANNDEEMKISNDGFISDQRFRIVSIGRLAEQKGFDFAIDAAKILKEKGADFCWYILGDGPLRLQLEKQIEQNGVMDYIKLIGIRSNPYAYIKHADVFAMTSRFEGKSIALDEAKILCKPIVVTKFPTVFDAINDGETGVLVEINPISIANGIYELISNQSLRQKLHDNLQKIDCSNEKQVVTKFISITDSISD